MGRYSRISDGNHAGSLDLRASVMLRNAACHTFVWGRVELLCKNLAVLETAATKQKDAS